MIRVSEEYLDRLFIHGNRPRWGSIKTLSKLEKDDEREGAPLSKLSRGRGRRRGFALGFWSEEASYVGKTIYNNIII